MNDCYDKKTWWKESVFYQIYPLSFLDTTNNGKGDIKGIIKKIPYLEELGIGAIWISPIYTSPMFDNGYDISDYNSINPLFGTMEDFIKLIKTCRKANIKIIMDLVINHTSSEHPWFKKSCENNNNPKSDYYLWHDAKNGKEPNNWAADFGGSAWTWNESRQQYYLHLFSKHQPDLNWHNPNVKKEIFSSIKKWLELGVNGFRMDMGNFLFKAKGYPDAPHDKNDLRKFIHGENLYANQPGIHKLLNEMKTELLEPYDAILFGEMYFLTPKSSLYYTSCKKHEVDLIYQYPIMDARGDWNKVKKCVRNYANAFQDKAWNTTTFSNHDSPRSVSIYGDTSNYHKESAKCIMTFLLTSPGTPFFLQGEEIGMTNTSVSNANELTDIKMKGVYNDRISRGENPNMVLKDLSWWNRDNARTPMQWSDKKYAGFSVVNPWLKVNPNYIDINVKNQQNNPNSILNYTKKLINLRNNTETLIYGTFKVLCPDDWTVYGFSRKLNDEEYIIVFNFSSNDNNIQAFQEIKNNSSTLILSNYSVEYDVIDILYMKPWETRIYKVKKHGEL